MNAMLTEQHEHVWGPGAACGVCAARRCAKWHCQAARVVGARCLEHAATAAGKAVPQGHTVRALTYSWPAARRQNPLHPAIAEATR